MIYLPIAVCLIGLLLFALGNNAKVEQIGFSMFGYGLLATLVQVALGKF